MTTVETLNWIDGNPVKGTPFDVINPAATSEVVGTAHAASTADVDTAVKAAVAAAGPWAATPVAERLSLVLDGMRRAVADPDLPALLTREQGKSIMESNIEIGHAVAMVEQFGSVAEATLAEETLPDEFGTRIRRFIPVGPVAAITPWNWPVVLSVVKLAPALLAGNPVVLKPPPNTPLTVTSIVASLAESLPPGVVNVLNGGAEVGAALASHPGIRKVAFTGSTPNGRRVFESAAGTIKNLTLELGGNDPAVLLDDVVLDERNLALLLGGTFVTSGQVCWAVKRVYVPRSRHDEIVGALTAAINTFVVGNGLEPEVRMGPLNNKMQLDIINDLEAGAQEAGAQVSRLGSYADGVDPEAGYFHLPTLITGVSQDAAVVQQEQFGPLLPVVAYDDEEQALSWANDTEYGLSASVWSADEARAVEFARRIEAGTVFVNAHGGPALDFTTGSGGVKQSGIGREMGREGLLEYVESQLVTSRVVLP
jgi:aldehyde dehydrogenase